MNGYSHGRRLPTAATALLAGALLLPSTAYAQAAPDMQDLVTQGEVLNRSITLATESQPGSRAAPEGAIDGEGGLYVLTLNEIFQISATAALGFTDNPTRTANNTGNSMFLDGGLSAGVATRIDEKVDAGMNLTLGAREFLSDSGASNQTTSVNAYLGTNLIGPVYGNVVAFGGFSFNSPFKESSSFYGVSGSVSAALPVSNKVLIRPGAGVARQWSGVSENNSTSINASVDVIAAVAPKLMASFRGSAGIRWYDDFYEDVTFIERRDNIYIGSAALAWQPQQNLTVSLNVTYEKQDSTFFVSDFSAFETAGAIAMRWRF